LDSTKRHEDGKLHRRALFEQPQFFALCHVLLAIRRLAPLLFCSKKKQYQTHYFLVGGSQLILPRAREEGSNWRPGKQINVADRALSTSQVITRELQSLTTSPAFTRPVRTYVSLLSHSNTSIASHLTFPAGKLSIP
jgi:hypothetical protein